MSNIPAVLLKPFYFLMTVIMLFFNWIDVPVPALGAPLDITGYQLVWSDEFEGDTLDLTKWGGFDPPIGSDPVEWENGYMDSCALSVQDGNLIMSIKRYPESAGELAGEYYYFMLDSRPGFSCTYGYFECRCKLAKATAGNCAFWLCSPVCGDYSVPKEEGVEIDIMESMQYGRKYQGSIERNIHYFDSTGHQHLRARFFKVGGDPYEEFNTYGLLWDENGYTFYINGKEFNHTDFGLSHGPEYVCLSNVMRNADDCAIVGDSADFVVDYVRVYQKAP